MNKNDENDSVAEIEGKFMTNSKSCFFCDKMIDVYFSLTKDKLIFYKNKEKTKIFLIISRSLVLAINRRLRTENDKNKLSIYYLDNVKSNMIKELKLRADNRSDMEKWIITLNSKIKPKRCEFNITFKNYVKANDIFHFENKSQFYVSLCNLEYILLKNKMKMFFKYYNYKDYNLIINNNDIEEKELIFIN